MVTRARHPAGRLHRPPQPLGPVHALPDGRGGRGAASRDRAHPPVAAEPPPSAVRRGALRGGRPRRGVPRHDRAVRPDRGRGRARVVARPQATPRAIAVARGDEPADLLITGGRVFSPATREWVDTALAVADGLVAGWGGAGAHEQGGAAGGAAGPPPLGGPHPPPGPPHWG